MPSVGPTMAEIEGGTDQDWAGRKPNAEVSRDFFPGQCPFAASRQDVHRVLIAGIYGHFL
jgi:hypothetical protein